MYIIKKALLNKDCDNRYCLKLNRQEGRLEVYRRGDETDLRKSHPIREDFDGSPYNYYTLYKTFDCIFGGEGSKRTVSGVFNIEKVSKDEYVSGYYEKGGMVKFFGYLVIFEDYFIHSDLYGEDVTKDDYMDREPVSTGDTHTSGCIRVSMEGIKWLVDNVPEGTFIEL